MTSFVLKIIAMITMLIDHIGDAYFGYATSLNVIGRIAFPIFAFQITEGYKHTKDLKKYFLRLFLFAIIAQIPFLLFQSLFTTEYGLNIFFTLITGLLAIFLYDKFLHTSFCFQTQWLATSSKYFLGIFSMIILGILAEVLKFDYGFFGVLIIFLFYALKDKKTLMVIAFVISCILKYGLIILTNGYHYFYILFCLFTIVPLIFICLYNGKQGKKVKYLLYFFYPVHLLVLYLVFGVFLT